MRVYDFADLFRESHGCLIKIKFLNAKGFSELHQHYLPVFSDLVSSGLARESDIS